MKEFTWDEPEKKAFIHERSTTKVGGLMLNFSSQHEFNKRGPFYIKDSFKKGIQSSITQHF